MLDDAGAAWLFDYSPAEAAIVGGWHAFADAKSLREGDSLMVEMGEEGGEGVRKCMRLWISGV